MPRLVAIDLPGGDAFVTAVRRAWDNGDAVLPIDQRLPTLSKTALLERMRPAAVIDGNGTATRSGSLPTEPGDALVIATSGSTGPPKGVVLTQRSLAAAASAAHQRLRIGEGDCWLACLPLSHIGGFGVVARSLISGCGLKVIPGFDLDTVQAAAGDGATAVALVPTTLRRIDPTWFRVVLLGGARPPADRPPHVVATYGLTESGGGVVYDGHPLEGVDVRIDEDHEIHLRSPTLMRSYRDGSSPIDPDGWLATGDLGSWQSDGRLHVEGRRGDLIITGGENVWPEQVEAALSSHPAVRDVAVGGVDDDEWGQRVVAWIVPADHSEPPTLDGLRTWTRESLPAFMAPRELRLITVVPRTALGKVARSALHDAG